MGDGALESLWVTKFISVKNLETQWFLWGYYSRSVDFNSGTQTATNETSEHLSQVTSHDGQMTEIQKKEKSHRGFLSIFNEKKIRLVFSPHKKL